jgi:hypothetical protein
MNTQPQDTSAEEPDGGNPHIRFRGGPGRGNQPGLLNRRSPDGAHNLLQVRAELLNGALVDGYRTANPRFRDPRDSATPAPKPLGASNEIPETYAARHGVCSATPLYWDALEFTSLKMIRKYEEIAARN